MITVINLHDAELPPHAVYVGRGMKRHIASPLANPFRMQGEWERPVVIQKYSIWLAEQLQRDTRARREFHRLMEIARHGDLILACWCSPKQCHADVIRQLIEHDLHEEHTRREPAP